MRIFILTIVDDANFQQLEHKSFWTTRVRAEHKAIDEVARLIERDKDHGLGDTFRVTIQEDWVQE